MRLVRRMWLPVAVATAIALFPIEWAAGSNPAVGFLGQHYGESIEGPSGREPESKLWWNDGIWWANLFQEEDNSFHIFQFDSAANLWADTGIRIDDRPDSRADTLWDGRHLYVLSHAFTRQPKPAERPQDWARLYRFSYQRSSRRYIPDPGFPVNVAPAKVEAMVLTKDSTGQLWVTYVDAGTVMVNRSLGSDLLWGTPFPLPVSNTGLSPGDTAAVVAFGGSKIGLLWTNQVENAVYFSAHADCAADEEWGATELALKAPGVLDDLLSVKSIRLEQGGWVYAAAKTGQGGGGDAVYVWVLSREPSGRWLGSRFGIARESHQRPSLVIDEENRRVYVFANAEWNATSKAIYFKHAALPNPAFPSGLGAAMIAPPESLAPDLVTTTKQNLSSASGLMLLGSDDLSRNYVYNGFGLESSPQGPPPQVDDAAGCNSR